MAKKRVQNPIRYRALRDDLLLGSASAIIERDYNLPPGSVRLVLPGGKKKMRADATIAALRAKYE